MNFQEQKILTGAESGRRKMVLMILPVKNEQGTIKQTIDEINSFCVSEFKQKFEVLCIDDGSSDDTLKTIKECGGRVRGIRNSFEEGKGSALKVGFIMSDYMYALSKDDLIVFIDGDGQIAPKEIKRLINIMNLYGTDCVMGNKRHAYSITKYSFTRRIISNGYNFFVRFLFGIDYRDTQCGVKIFKKYALDKVMNKINIKQYAFDIELIVALKESGMMIADCPVKIGKQLNAGSVSFYSILRTLTDTLLIWVRKKRGKYVDLDY